MYTTGKAILAGLMCLVLFTWACSGESNQQKSENEAMPDTPAVKKERDITMIIPTDSLSPDQQEQWDTISSKWMYDTFSPALKKHGFKQDCIDCADIYFTARISIDNNGRVTKLDIVSQTIQCKKKSEQQTEALIKDLMEPLRSVTFPTKLRNMTLEAGIGQRTKC